MKEPNINILLAEDDENLGKLLWTYLKNKGFDVVLAKNGKLAYDLFNDPKNSFDFLILDVMMPGQNGYELVKEIKDKGIDISNGKVVGLQTTKGSVKVDKVGLVPAGHSSVLANMAGFSLPINSVPLQALVSEPVKPILDCVIMSNSVHVYVSQSDKGELVVGAGSDAYNSYSQRGSFDMIEHMMAPLVELFPIFSRLKMLRSWGGIVDVTPDRSPIIGKTPVKDLFINCGWGTGGFKATPGSAHVFAETVFRGEPNDIAAPFSLERHFSGALVDEAAAAAVAH